MKKIGRGRVGPCYYYRCDFGTSKLHLFLNISAHQARKYVLQQNLKFISHKV
jgi:hypothetical protein